MSSLSNGAPFKSFGLIRFQTFQWFQTFQTSTMFKVQKFNVAEGASTFREFSKRRNEGCFFVRPRRRRSSLAEMAPAFSLGPGTSL